MAPRWIALKEEKRAKKGRQEGRRQRGCEGGGGAHEHSTEDKNNRNTKTGANQQSNNRNQVNEGDEQ